MLFQVGTDDANVESVRGADRLFCKFVPGLIVKGMGYTVLHRWHLCNLCLSS